MLISWPSPWALEMAKVVRYSANLSGTTTYSPAAHKRSGSIATGAQLAMRGRRDMSSRVKDVVLSLALCHNVESSGLLAYRS